MGNQVIKLTGITGSSPEILNCILNKKFPDTNDATFSFFIREKKVFKTDHVHKKDN